ncbi:Plastin-3 [Sparganum proliferum]
MRVRTIAVDNLMGGSSHFKLASREFFKQVMLKGYFRKISIHDHPEMFTLKLAHEGLQDIRCLSPQDNLNRYVNSHLKSVGITKTPTTFDYDLSDCVVYAYLLHKIAPAMVRPRLLPPDQVLLDIQLLNRAKAVLQNLCEPGAEMFLCEDNFSNSFTNRETRGMLLLISVAFRFNRIAAEMKTYGPGDRLASQENINELSFRKCVN